MEFESKHVKFKYSAYTWQLTGKSGKLCMSVQFKSGDDLRMMMQRVFHLVYMWDSFIDAGYREDEFCGHLSDFMKLFTSSDFKEIIIESEVK